MPTAMRMQARTDRGVLRRIRLTVVGLLVGLVVGVFAIELLRPTVVRHTGVDAQSESDASTGGLSSHVVIVSIDGLRPDAIDRYGAPTLQRLIRTGRSTLRARTVVPSKTLPAHTSMLTGASVEQHHVTWNEPLSDSVLHVPTIFERAHGGGLVTAAFFSKPKMEMLAAGSGYDYVQRPIGGLMGLLGTDVYGDVRALLRETRPNLLFVHIGEPDYIGHLVGWMTPFYGNAVLKADDALAEIIGVADSAFGVGEYTLIVTADHGGHGRDHTGPDSVDAHIPWIVAGKGVRGTGALHTPVRVYDTGPTALWLLGVGYDPSLAGRPVREAFTGPAGGAATAPSPSR